MFNGNESVGFIFRRAFHRIDGWAMYFFLSIWLLISAWIAATKGFSIEVVAHVMLALLSPFLFLLLGLWRWPGLLVALIIVFFNLRFLWTFLN